MSAWTPGPWEVGDNGDVWGPDDELICFGLRVLDPSPRTDEQRHANAHLISAAPDLYQALDGLLGVVMAPEPPPGRVRDNSAQIEAARRALARARGATPNC